MSCFPSQYLFPDAAVEKSSEKSKTKDEGLDSSGNVEQDKNSDYVSWFSCSMDDLMEWRWRMLWNIAASFWEKYNFSLHLNQSGFLLIGPHGSKTDPKEHQNSRFTRWNLGYSKLDKIMHHLTADIWWGWATLTLTGKVLSPYSFQTFGFTCRSHRPANSRILNRPYCSFDMVQSQHH